VHLKQKRRRERINTAVGSQTTAVWDWNVERAASKGSQKREEDPAREVKISNQFGFSGARPRQAALGHPSTPNYHLCRRQK